MDQLIGQISGKISDLARRVSKLESQEPAKQYGTVFPATPYTSQRYFRTDRGIEYYYDGTRWLSAAKIIISGTLLPQNPAATSVSVAATLLNWMAFEHPDNSSDIYVESFVSRLNVATTNNSTNYWQIDCKFRSQTPTVVATYSGDTKTGTAGQITPVTATVGAVITRSNFYDVIVDLTKVNAPGNVSFGPIYILCRFVG
jgi:hypothetical protein